MWPPRGPRSRRHQTRDVAAIPASGLVQDALFDGVCRVREVAALVEVGWAHVHTRVCRQARAKDGGGEEDGPRLLDKHLRGRDVEPPFTPRVGARFEELHVPVLLQGSDRCAAKEIPPHSSKRSMHASRCLCVCVTQTIVNITSTAHHNTSTRTSST